MASPRRDTPGARARRALLVDVLTAIALAALVLFLSAGLGVVGFVGVPLLALGLLWVAAERVVATRRRRAARRTAGLERVPHREGSRSA